MNKYVVLVLLAVGVLTLAGASYAASSSDVTKDEYIFERLLSERTEIYEQYVRALRKGKEELKAEGDIDIKVKNDILALRAKKDRVETRILTIALRHGWDVPSLSDPKLGKNLDIEARELEKVFGMAKVLVKSELHKDVGQFTANLNLPIQKLSVK